MEMKFMSSWAHSGLIHESRPRSASHRSAAGKKFEPRPVKNKADFATRCDDVMNRLSKTLDYLADR